MSIVIREADLPPPDALVQYKSGSSMAVMFHFAPAESNPSVVADENGFDLRFIRMEDDLELPADSELLMHPLSIEYDEGGNAESILSRWHPKSPQGWAFAGKWDTEDEGLVAAFVRPKVLST